MREILMPGRNGYCQAVIERGYDELMKRAELINPPGGSLCGKHTRHPGAH
jgi:hypothetical protein